MQTAIEIAAQVRDGRRTPREVVEEALARIAEADPGIGAFQVVDAAGARRAAEEVASWADLDRLPLAGVPVAIKDNVAVAGLPTRHGSGASSAEPEAADDELVRRLRAAGAVVVGKTRLPELAIWGFTESIALGGTRNPHDPSRNAGGSTGGGAAAVAAGMVPLALGSDGGGSLRIPAANCGVVGFKPATGALPLAGGLADHWYGCSAFGPIASTVDDAVLMLDVLAGGAQWRGSASTATGPLRVAVSLRSPSPIGRAGSGARQALRVAAERARTAGHTVRAANPPYPLTLATSWMQCWFAGIAEEVERLDLDPARLEPRTRGMATRGQRLRRKGRPTGGPAKAWRDRASAWFEQYDVMLSPVIAGPAPKMDWGTRAGFLPAYLQGARATPYTQAWNLSGFPAMSLPIVNAAGLGNAAGLDGVTGGRLAGAAVQLVAVPGREWALIALARQLAPST
jgi:amidase